MAGFNSDQLPLRGEMKKGKSRLEVKARKEEVSRAFEAASEGNTDFYIFQMH